MTLFVEAFAWIVANLGPAGEGELWTRLGEHVLYTLVSVVIAAAIAIPAGYLIGHTGRGREIAVAISGAARALPSFGLILFFVLLLGTFGVGLGVRVAAGSYIAFVILAIPSILAGAYAGLEAIDRSTISAARAIGMTEWQILWKVEVPLGLPLLIGGLRSATLQVVATATLAAYVNLGGLGFDIIQGLPLRRYDQMLGAALLVVALAFALDALFGLAAQITERIIPDGRSAPRSQPRRTRPLRPRASSVGTPTNN